LPGLVLQTTSDLAAPTWTEVQTSEPGQARIPIGSGAQFFRLMR
jgi:hypothetical protein